nr:NADH dehydrogenase subunit 5 [Dielis tejensis]
MKGNLFYMWSFFLLLMSLILYILGINFLLDMKKLMFEMELLSYYINSISINIYVDWVSLLFSSVVLWISSMIMCYSNSYMMNFSNYMKKRFLFLMILFIFSMMVVIYMFNTMAGLILGWDGLGLSSYCLVIFYQNYQSLNSGMITIMVNRMGDIAIIMILSMMMIMNNCTMNVKYLNNMQLILILIAAFTKSAQIPFSPWLLKAMAAPTPVSALVHSSTLVTAGMYILIRYNDFYYNSSYLSFMFFIGSLTMFSASLLANIEVDIKKIIALSTLSQLGLMLMILSMGYKDLAYFHLLTHAMFKSVLFMCAGTFIHNMKGNQDIRYYGSMFHSLPITSMIFTGATFSLCGFPFLSGFYSKDLILEMLYMNKYNILSFIMLNMSMCMTCSYSIRLTSTILFSTINWSPSINIKETKIMYIPMILLFLQSIFFGYLMMKYFMTPINSYIIVLKWYMKMLIIYLTFFSLSLFKMFKYINYLPKFILKLNKYFLFLDLWYNASMMKFLSYTSGCFEVYIDKITTMLIQMYHYKMLSFKLKYKLFMHKIFNGLIMFLLLVILIYCL